MEKKPKKYCIECGCDNKVRIATYECIVCGEGVCKKCEENLMGECSQCPPPMLYKIKK